MNKKTLLSVLSSMLLLADGVVSLDVETGEVIIQPSEEHSFDGTPPAQPPNMKLPDHEDVEIPNSDVEPGNPGVIEDSNGKNIEKEEEFPDSSEAIGI